MQATTTEWKAKCITCQTSLRRSCCQKSWPAAKCSWTAASSKHRRKWDRTAATTTGLSIF